MYKVLLAAFSLIPVQVTFCMQNHHSIPRFTIVTPDNIEEILNSHRFKINNKELKGIVRKQKMTVFLIQKPQECYLKVKKYGKEIKRYYQIGLEESSCD